MLLVVVGNIESRPHRASRARDARESSAGQLHVDAAAATAGRKVGCGNRERALPTNYIVGYYSGPLANTRGLSGAANCDVGAHRADVLGDSYAAEPHVRCARAIPRQGGQRGRAVRVDRGSPDTTLELMYNAVRELQEGLLDPSGLERLEQQFLTEYFLDNETNDAQADFLARAQLYRGDYRLADKFVEELKSVTPEAVQVLPGST